ncbi:MAG: hypothetical protein JJE50_10410 [Actinomycetales bacterium]|nr:hypothetical protein [Actinomycetales bacterium]
MAEEATVSRLRRPSWRDPRLGVGVLLVVGSVALGSWVVSRADDTVEVYSAREALSPGDPLDATTLEIVRVRMAGVEDVYLVAGEPLAEDAVAVRTIDAGELVPGSAVGRYDDVEVRPVSLPMNAAMESYLGKGARVDLWVAMPEGSGGLSSALLAPVPLVENVEVWDIHEDSSLFAGADQVQVQVLIPVEDLAAVLTALSGEGEITIVPLPGGTGGTGVQGG